MSLALRSQQLAQRLRKQQRENTKLALRNQLLQPQAESYPLISSVLSNFWSYSHQEVAANLDAVLLVVSSAELPTLDEENHEDIITDLLYLVHQHSCILPYGLRFKRDDSLRTASLVAMSPESFQEDELIYWIANMEDDEKELMFMQIEPEAETLGELGQSSKWLAVPSLFQCLLSHSSRLISAAAAIKELVSEKTLPKYIQALADFVAQVLKERSCPHWVYFIEIQCKLVQICSQIGGWRGMCSEMVQLINSSIEQGGFNINVDTLAALLSLYQTCSAPILRCDETILKICSMMEAVQEESEEASLRLRYYYELIYLHWRYSNLKNYGYTLPPQLWIFLEHMGPQTLDDPYRLKLFKIRKE